jgi:hypothetical protein
VQELEEDLETTETKCQIAIVKLDKAATTADDSDRMAKVLQNRWAFILKGQYHDPCNIILTLSFHGRCIDLKNVC